MSYLDAAIGPTPQTEALPGQVANSAGGFSYAVDDWTRLERFLILGSEGGTYYATERDITKENVDAVKRCLDADWHRAVDTAATISESGRAPKNDPAILVLALAACHDLSKPIEANSIAEFVDRDILMTRAEYLQAALMVVCRIGTHILRFCSFVDQMRGWGRALRRIVSEWYLDRTPDELAYQMVKYANRYGWTHHDVFHKAHPAFTEPGHKMLAKWAKDGNVRRKNGEYRKATPALFQAIGDLGVGDFKELIRNHRIPREALPTEWLTDPDVWGALLEHMPMTAMVRNLATMTRVGLIAPGSDATKLIVERLADQERIQNARIHPLNVLSAMFTYKAGRGVRGKHTWTPVPQITDALDGAFYAAFGNLERSDKRVLIGLDVSGSMDRGDVGGIIGLTPRVASTALAMVAVEQFPGSEVVGFTSENPTGSRLYGGNAELMPLDVTRRRRIDDVCRETERLRFGGTDCSLPMRWAMSQKREFDAFHVYTDNETWAGPVHPSKALADYRKRHVAGAKLVVVGMVANGFTIADPADAGMLDVVGFDTATPNLIADFTSK